MTDNKALHNAARAQQDEFYTQMGDIAEELRHYREHFRDKKILCNCDDPYESNFFRYFALNFNVLGLKKLTATCYNGSPIAGTQLAFDFDSDSDSDSESESGRSKKSYCAEITEFRDYNGDTAEDLQDIRYILEHNIGGGVRELRGTGDFRSEECIELLKDADIVVTNPPFSLFREYVAQLIQYGKKFLIMGNKNSVTYKEIFPLIMHNKMWIGFRNMNQDFWLEVPTSERYEKVDEKGRRLKHIMACWFTNLDITKRHEFLFPIEHYTPERFPKYDNYDAIEVSKVMDIPCDYEGIMGVPITFLDKYNPEQFEILGCTYIYGDPGCHIPGTSWNAQINGKDIYKRLFIRKIAERDKVYSIIHHGEDSNKK